MTIMVNDQAQPLASNLAELLDRMALGDAVVATALNGHFVTVGERVNTLLAPGDRVEILAPMQGG
ncbi:sulfur carrier protein ThiS [Dyella sp. A6]|uniref:sulfur carrier protein ThiS n=1 Tax=Dyella aluminiiresistens TaxID=3069105 RepID=UPI002E79358A|nr:sulfur carrier protein ThiS [Dyella sp. A6]